MSASLERFYGALLDDDAAALYEQAPCAYLSTTPDGLIVKVNETFLQWTGLDRDAVVGRLRFTDLLTVGSRIYHETHHLPTLMMHGRAQEIALDLLCADGRILPAIMNSVIERDLDGQPVVIRTALFDATERRRYEQELLVAKRRAEESEREARVLSALVQQTLIPPAVPTIDGLAIAAAYRPAGLGDEIGGDFYDIFELPGGSWVIVVGDVEGKGVEAAVVTALVRHVVRAAAAHSERPAQILREVNRAIFGHPSDRYCTAAVLWLRPAGAGWKATIGLAGHPPALLTPAGTQLPTAIGHYCKLLGAFEDPEFSDITFELGPGDALVLYTDGVTEARGATGWYGQDRLTDLLESVAGVDPGAVVDRVLADVLTFQDDLPRDDIALVAITAEMRPAD